MRCFSEREVHQLGSTVCCVCQQPLDSNHQCPKGVVAALDRENNGRILSRSKIQRLRDGFAMAKLGVEDPVDGGDGDLVEDIGGREWPKGFQAQL